MKAIVFVMLAVVLPSALCRIYRLGVGKYPHVTSYGSVIDAWSFIIEAGLVVWMIHALCTS